MCVRARSRVCVILYITVNNFSVMSVRVFLGGTSNKSKKDDKDQETIQSSTAPDPGYHKGK